MELDQLLRYYGIQEGALCQMGMTVEDLKKSYTGKPGYIFPYRFLNESAQCSNLGGWMIG